MHLEQVQRSNQAKKYFGVRCTLMHCQPLITDYVMYAFVLFSWPLSLKNWPLKQVYRGHFGPQVKFSGWNTVNTGLVSLRYWQIDHGLWNPMCPFNNMYKKRNTREILTELKQSFSKLGTSVLMACLCWSSSKLPLLLLLIDGNINFSII